MNDLDLTKFRDEISRLDEEIISLVLKRTKLARDLGNAKVASGGTKISTAREFQIVQHYSRDLGVIGRELGNAMLRLSRGSDAA